MDEREKPYSAAERARWKKEILNKGQDISEQLTKLLSNKNATLATLHSKSREKAERKEKRLRQFMEQIQNALNKLSGNDFGRCTSCKQFLSISELSEIPWAERCNRCPST